MSSDLIAVFDGGTHVGLLAPGQSVLSIAVDNAPTPEDAISDMLKVAPPASVKYTFVLNYDGFQFCQRSVEALQKAGYTNIESIEVISLSLSSNIWNLPINGAVGELVFVISGLEGRWSLEKCDVSVIRKCENNWRAVKSVDIPQALIEFPWVCDIVFYKDAPEADKAKIKQLFPGCKFHPSVMMHPDFKTTFVRNRINKGDLGGFEVLPFCRYSLIVKFGDKVESISLDDHVPPFTISKEFSVGNVPTIQIRARESGKSDMPLVKTFKFKTAAFRTVSITINVDKTLLPQVSLKTITVREGPNRKTSVVYTVVDVPTGFTLTAHKRDDKFERFELSSINDVIESMKKQTNSHALVVFSYTKNVTLSILREFRTACREAGYSNLQFISSESSNYSMLLSLSDHVFITGQLVAILFLDIFLVLEKVDERLKVRKSCDTNFYEVDECNVHTVIITDMFPSTVMPYLNIVRESIRAETYRIMTSQILTELCPKYLWSLADGENYNGYLFEDYCDFDVVIYGQTFYMTADTRFKTVPFAVTVDAEVDNSTLVTVSLYRREKTHEKFGQYAVPEGTKSGRFTICVESACDVTITLDVGVKVDGSDVPKEKSQETAEDGNLSLVNVEEVDPLESVTSEDTRLCISCGRRCECTQYPSEKLSQLKLDPSPTVILTFTSDNRVLIEADETYTGNKQILAYVQLQSGMPPIVGKRAFKALKNQSDSVFYDITRLLAIDFDPNYPHPLWSFKTTRDADGKVVICGCDNVETTPIVMFGLVVNSTLLYMKEHMESDVATLGIKLPWGCKISDDELEKVSERIGVKLVFF